MHKAQAGPQVYERFTLECDEAQGRQQAVIRQATVADAPAVLALKLAILRQGIYDALLPEEYTFDEAQEAHWIEHNQASSANFMAVSEVGGKITGVLYFQSSNELRCRHWGEFGMGIAENMRGKGLGTKLLDALFAWGETAPRLEKICLKVFDVNEGAHRLYKKLGFEEEGRLKKCLRLKDGTYTDAILMAKFLNKKKSRADNE